MTFSNHFWEEDSASSAYQIKWSLIFGMANRAVDATNPGGENGTYSIWIKRGELARSAFIGAGMRWYSNDTLNGSTVVFKDYVSWMHVVVHQSGTFVNGIQISDGPASDANSTKAGNYGWSCQQQAAEFQFVEGQELDPSYFGTIGPNGVWIPIEYKGEYGDHGFHLKFDPYADPNIKTSLGLDSSGNGNHFILTNNFQLVSNRGDFAASPDTPTNNAAKQNVWYKTAQSWSYANCGYYQKVEASNGNNERMGICFLSELPKTGKWWFQTQAGSSQNNGQRNAGFAFTPRSVRGFTSNSIRPSTGYYTGFRAGNYRQLVYGLDGSVLGTRDKGSAGSTDAWKGQSVVAWDGDTREIWFGAVYYNPDQAQWTGEIEWLGEYGRSENDPESNPATGTNPTLVLPEEYDTIWSYVSRKTGNNENQKGTAQLVTYNFNGLSNVPAGFKYLDPSLSGDPADIADTITGDVNNGWIVYTGCLPARIRYGDVDVTYQNRFTQSDVYFLSYGFWVNNNPGATTYTVDTRHTGGEYIGRKIPWTVGVSPSN